MQELFLTEVLTTVITPAAYTRTTDVYIPAQNNIILYSSAFIDFKPGAVISISGGPRYDIQTLIYDSLTQTYRVQVLGGIQPLNRQSVTWEIFNVASTASATSLDIENIDITTDFAVSDLADISSRKDSITKTIQLKGTETNNRAFGHLFHLGRHASFTLANKLFFNYTPIRTVDCLLYEDGMPILRGYLFVTEIKVDHNGGIIYNANIVGSFINFKTTLADKKMTDLDLRDMEHTYSGLAVLDSWGGDTGTADAVGNSRTYWTNQVTGVPYTKPFAFGTGYVYPTIDYGEQFKQAAGNSSYADFKMQNYRPAVYAREFFNRIFKDANFTYELLGSPEFVMRFNKMITPDSGENITSLQSGTAGQFSGGSQIIQGMDSGTQTTGYMIGSTNDGLPTTSPLTPGLWAAAYRYTIATNTSSFEIDDIGYPNSNTGIYPGPGGVPFPNNFLLLRAKKDIRISARLQCSLNIHQKEAALGNQVFRVQLCKRARNTAVENTNTQEYVNSWEVVAEQLITSVYNVNTAFNLDFTTPQILWNQGDQVQVRVAMTQANLFPPNAFTGQWNSLSLTFPGSATELYNVEVQVGDKIVPRAPGDMTQFDYVKSVINSLNLYVTPSKDNSRHLVMQTYDDFYGLTQPMIIKTTALDWTNKADLSKGFRIKSNLSQPKKYLFTFQDDNDYLNTQYKNRTGRVYGDFRFNDSLGFTDQKTVQLGFAATPPAQIPGREKRFIPIIASGGTSLDKKTRMKTKPRLLYYSGVYYDKDAPVVSEDDWIVSGETNGMPGAWLLDNIFYVQWYALCGNYLFDNYNDIFHPATSKTTDLIPIYDIHFAPPQVWFFKETTGYTGVPTHYAYYRQQTTELTNPNLHTVIIGVNLTEVDINNLSLKVPVLINLGDMGYAYYKVIQLGYTNANKITPVTLQKIPN